MYILRRYYRETRDTLRYHGLLVLLYKILIKCASPFARVGIDILFYMDLSEPLSEKHARIEIDIREASEAEIERLVRVQYGTPLPLDARLSDDEEYEEALRTRQRAVYRERYAEDLRIGDKCFVARVGEEIVHINWSRYPRAHPVPGCVFDLAPDEVFTTDAFTPDEWRGKSIHTAVLNAMLRFAQGIGRRKAYTSTGLEATGSRRGLLRLGWKPIGTLLYVIPRRFGRTYLIRLQGDLGPLLRPVGLQPD